jgi:hypothetical protein
MIAWAVVITSPMSAPPYAVAPSTRNVSNQDEVSSSASCHLI